MPSTWPVATVRQTFIDFFAQKHGHTFVPSSPVVPHDDPTLLFTNAGMNQFKPIFLGQAPANSPLGLLKRAANSQKCIRAGGKHNDLEDVGKDTYHHTFFEMLGNWSFADYFKKEAIDWSWELLTKVYGLPPVALYATYFGGDEAAGVAADLETKALWERYLPPERVLPGNMKDNFWMMGDSGPCGPCTEIHVDRITAMGEEIRDVAGKVNQSDPDVIEIWNNVFIQFNAEYPAEGLAALRAWDTTPEAQRAELGYTSRAQIEAKFRKLITLPGKHVDTGMGLERLTSILQRKRSNYDSDAFSGIFRSIEEITGATPYMGKLGEADKNNADTAYRVIADHVRTLTFAITDGALPSNVGRGYVLRRILRRAVRYGRQMLNAKPGFFARLVPTVVSEMGDFFPELKKNPQRVIDIIAEEEESFGKTLDRGITLFNDLAFNLKRAGTTVFPGADAFKLYDTFGFPVDLTELMASERGLTVDKVAYDAAEKRAQEISKSGGKSAETSGRPTLDGEAIARLKALKIQPTDDMPKFDDKPIRARVRAIWNGHNFDEHARGGLGTKHVGLVLEKTSFYSEMGGQEADHGRITDTMGGEFRVEHVASFGGYVLHVGQVVKGEFKVNETVELHVDRNRRGAIESNHTATHLLNFGLRKVLGDHIDQKGSLVTPDRFRFDFSHTGPVSPAEAAKVEEIVADQIRQNLTVYAQPSDLATAKRVNGLRAVFGEAYPDPVRVVSIGMPVLDLTASPESPMWRELSIEFCGGTHVATTGVIQSFAIIAEEAVAKGVRRLTALTGEAAAASSKLAHELHDRIVHAAKISEEHLPKALLEITQAVDAAAIPLSLKASLRNDLAMLGERVKSALKAAGAVKRDAAVREAKALAASAANANDAVVVGTIDAGDDRQALQAALKTVCDNCPRAAVLLVSVVEPAGGESGKVSMIAQVPAAIQAKGLKAGDWIRESAAIVGGKGGGKADQAQGGGTDTTKVREALAHAHKFAAKMAL